LVQPGLKHKKKGPFDIFVLYFCGSQLSRVCGNMQTFKQARTYGSTAVCKL